MGDAGLFVKTPPLEECKTSSISEHLQGGRTMLAKDPMANTLVSRAGHLRSPEVLP